VLGLLAAAGCARGIDANAPGSVTRSSGRSRPALIAGISANDWDECPFPAEADRAKVDDAVVLLQVLVAPDGHAEGVTILRDPGYGFGEVARGCAMTKRYIPGRDARRTAIESRTMPFRMHYSRPKPAGE